MTPRRRRVWYVAATLLLVVALLPWLGLGGYAFYHPMFDTPLPRLELIRAPRLYDVIAFPIDLLGQIPGVGHWVYFGGEGVVRVRPIVVSEFYGLLGLLALSRARLARLDDSPAS